MSFLIRITAGSRSLLLLASLILLMLLAPQAESSVHGRALTNLLFALVLLAAIHSVSGLNWHRGVAISLAALWLALQLWGTATHSQPLELAAMFVFICFGGHSAAVVLWRAVTAERVNFEVVCALPSIYLLFAAIWAVSYQIIETLSPGSFQGGRDGAVPGIAEFLYFSLTTITTLGYGDITPVGPVTRMWVTLEAVAGVFYIAILVARLVTLYRS